MTFLEEGLHFGMGKDYDDMGIFEMRQQSPEDELEKEEDNDKENWFTDRR
jgi:hypothetical protein